MDAVFEYLEERCAEFDRHIAVARMIESRVDQQPLLGIIPVEVRHLNTIKSGLLIHLYNIVEATLTQILSEVGNFVVSHKPAEWRKELLSEWVKSKVWSDDRIAPQNAISKFTDVGETLAAGGYLSPFELKGASGTWDDQAVVQLSKRLNCKLILRKDVKRKALEKVYRNDTTALGFLAKRRNDIAHGATTFEDGAQGLTLDEIEELGSGLIART